MLFSVLIPTLECRRPLLARVYEQLAAQAKAMDGGIEILCLRDNGERSTGWKRNRLVARARGEFVAFVDDDDRVSEDYLRLIAEAIGSHPGIDCIGIRGLITFRGGHPREFVRSLRYADQRCRNGVYLGPPYHLNPVRRSIAARYPFADVSYSEDIDWSMRLARDGALRSECFLESVLYHYECRTAWPYQWLMDRTERLRHSLGLRLYNRLRLERGARALLSRAAG
jgi:glycosyltransferase involved in cell wall biosynthesis